MHSKLCRLVCPPSTAVKLLQQQQRVGGARRILISLVPLDDLEVVKQNGNGGMCTATGCNGYLSDIPTSLQWNQNASCWYIATLLLVRKPLLLHHMAKSLCACIYWQVPRVLQLHQQQQLQTLEWVQLQNMQFLLLLVRKYMISSLKLACNSSVSLQVTTVLLYPGAQVTVLPSPIKSKLKL